MRRWFWLTLGLFLLVGIPQVFAQDQTDQVFFGIRNDGTVISYTLDGKSTDLLSKVNPDDIRMFSTSQPNTALMIAEVDGKRGLYLVGPRQQPQMIKLPEGYDLSDKTFIPNASHDPYYVLQSVETLPRSTGLVVNIDKLEAQALTGVIFFSGQPNIMLSKDSTKVRYLSRNEQTTDTWDLIERDLASAQEKTLYTIKNDSFPILSYDPNGEHWLYRMTDRDTGIAHVTLISADGQSKEIAQDDRKDYQARFVWNDSLYVSPVICQKDCPIKIVPLDKLDDVGVSFTLPEVETLATPIAMPAPDRLVVFEDDHYWMLKSDGSATLLGFQNPVVVFTPNVLSADKRWLLTTTGDALDAQTGYAVWDLQANKTILEGTLPRGLIVTYNDQGIIIWEQPDTQKIYRVNDGKTFTVTVDKEASFFLLVDPKTALVRVIKGSTIGDEGIYSYDLETQKYSLVAKDVRPLFPLP